MTQRCKICHQPPGLETLDCNGPQCKKWREETALKAMEYAPSLISHIAEEKRMVGSYEWAEPVVLRSLDDIVWPVFGPDGSSNCSHGMPSELCSACAPATPASDGEDDKYEIVDGPAWPKALNGGENEMLRGLLAECQAEVDDMRVFLSEHGLLDKYDALDDWSQPSPDSLAIANVAKVTG